MAPRWRRWANVYVSAIAPVSGIPAGPHDADDRTAEAAIALLSPDGPLGMLAEAARA